MRTIVLSIGLIALVGLSPARAADDEEKAAKEAALALAEELDTLRKDEKAGELAEAVARAPEVYKATKDKGARGKLCGSLGDVAKDDDVGEARVPAVVALVALEDPKDAWKEIYRLMPDPKAEGEASDLDIAVVKASGDLAQSRAIKPLFELLQKAEDPRVAAEAAIALGGFGEERKRTNVLEELIDMGRRIRPGYSTEKGVSQTARERWDAVGPGIVKGLNRLTNREIRTFEEWELLYEDNKRRLKDLFRDAEG